MLHSCGEFIRHSGVCIIYVFFTASTHHYEVLGNTLKSADDLSACQKGSTLYIRWSYRADASKAFVQGYPEIKNVLAEFADNPSEVPKVRSESNGLYERMCLLETGMYSVFWNEILERVNANSRKLQDPTLDLNAVVSLKRFVEAKRDTFTEYERHGATLSGTSDYGQTRQRPRNVRMLNSLLLRSFVSPVTFR